MTGTSQYSLQKIKGMTVQRGGSSGSYSKEMVRTWYETANRSSYEKLRSEKLDQRRLTNV